MAERENRTVKIGFRAEPSQVARWQKAIDKQGIREASDFYRDAIDKVCDTVLEQVDSKATKER